MLSTPPDSHWMQAALEEARRAGEAGEAPVGAALVKDGSIVARAGDQRERTADPTAHAERIVLAEGGRRLGDWRLDGCDLFVTLEPCPMCAGAAIMARVRRVVFGAPSVKSGAVETHCRLLDVETFNHRVAFTGGVEADAASALLREFFQGLRKNKQ